MAELNKFQQTWQNTRSLTDFILYKTFRNSQVGGGRRPHLCSLSPEEGGISSRIVTSIWSREGTGNALVSRKKKSVDVHPLLLHLQNAEREACRGLAAQAPLLAGVLADVCGRPIQFVSSDYGAANEISVPGALGPAGVELPCATKLHIFPLSLAAVTGLWRGRGGSLRQGDGPASHLWGGHGLVVPLLLRAPTCGCGCGVLHPATVCLYVPGMAADRAGWHPLRCQRGFRHHIWPPARLWLMPGCVSPLQPSTGAAQLLTEELLNPHKWHVGAEVKWKPGLPLLQPGRWPQDASAAEAGSCGKSPGRCLGTCLCCWAPNAPTGITQ